VSREASFELKATALREAFDRSFASPPPTVSSDFEDLLSIRVAGDAYVIRLRDITRVVAKRTIVPVPAAAPHLIGLLGLDGEVVPVFGLASLLGYDHEGEAPPWLVVCGPRDPVALGFSELEAHLRLARSALRADDAARSHTAIDEVAVTASGVRPVIAVPRLIRTIRDRLDHRRSNEEP
jgi:purine-binding chemotaxis protein CheW